MILMMSVVTVVGMLCGTLIHMQREAAEFRLKYAKVKNDVCVDEKYQALSKEFEEYKKRVDALTLRAGFKS